MNPETIKDLISDETEKFYGEIATETEIGSVQRRTMLATATRLKERILKRLEESKISI